MSALKVFMFLTLCCYYNDDWLLFSSSAVALFSDPVATGVMCPSSAVQFLLLCTVVDSTPCVFHFVFASLV